MTGVEGCLLDAQVRIAGKDREEAVGGSSTMVRLAARAVSLTRDEADTIRTSEKDRLVTLARAHQVQSLHGSESDDLPASARGGLRREVDRREIRREARCVFRRPHLSERDGGFSPEQGLRGFRIQS